MSCLWLGVIGFDWFCWDTRNYNEEYLARCLFDLVVCD